MKMWKIVVSNIQGVQWTKFSLYIIYFSEQRPVFLLNLTQFFQHWKTFSLCVSLFFVLKKLWSNANLKLSTLSYFPQTQVSLIYDAVFVFAIGLQTLQHSSELHFSNVSCKEEKALHSGSSLINFINTVRIFSFRFA